MNWTPDDLEEFYARRGGAVPAEVLQASSGLFVATAPKARRRREVYFGPLYFVMTLHGPCPSKKNTWKIGGAGMAIPGEVKRKIEALTTQALFQWEMRDPVEHPNVTVQFFVSAQRQDRDGMLTTVLDCLQSAGVIVNDNIAHFNGRIVVEPCVAVSAGEERTEIRLEKTA